MKYSIPGALFILSLLSYALLVPWLGFYWDDWPAVWFYHSLGAGGFREVFAADRPLLAWLFTLTTPIFRESTFLWQSFGILARWLSSVAFWWFLSELFPTWKRLAAAAAFLFLVYPGFQQQFVSVTYSHAFVLYTLFILSLALMVVAARNLPRYWPIFILSILLSVFGLFTVEYYFGLELLRPVILWIVFSEQYQQFRPRLKKTLLFWSPYLAALIAFLVYTIFLRETPRGQVEIFDMLFSSPITGVLYLASTIIKDWFESGLYSWIKTIDIRSLLDFNPGYLLVYLIVSLASAGFTYYFFRKVLASTTDENKPQNSGPLQYVVLGGLALMLGGWPFWATDLQLKLRFPLDRFTLPMIFGASLAAAGLIFLLFKSNRSRAVVLCVLVGLCTGSHFKTGLNYLREWELQKDFFHQLTWRAPEILPSTILLTPELPFTYYSDNSLTAPLNWTYDPDNRSSNMPLLMLDLEARLGNEIRDFNPQNRIVHNYRAKIFSGKMSDTLVFFYDPPRCLIIYDPEVENTIPQNDYIGLEAQQLSNPKRIFSGENSGAYPPVHLFGPTRETSWCYYFESAELARQRGDWMAIVELGEHAKNLFPGLSTENSIELLPFIEGYARSGSVEKAINLSQQTYAAAPNFLFALCATWDRIQEANTISQEAQNLIQYHYQDLGCEDP